MWIRDSKNFLVNTDHLAAITIEPAKSNPMGHTHVVVGIPALEPEDLNTGIVSHTLRRGSLAACTQLLDEVEEGERMRFIGNTLNVYSKEG